jgi:hypothetical protein
MAFSSYIFYAMILFRIRWGFETTYRVFDGIIKPQEVPL